MQPAKARYTRHPLAPALWTKLGRIEHYLQVHQPAAMPNEKARRTAGFPEIETGCESYK